MFPKQFKVYKDIDQKSLIDGHPLIDVWRADVIEDHGLWKRVDSFILLSEEDAFKKVEELKLL